MGALVQVTVACEMCVCLLEHFESKLGKAQPCSAHTRPPSDGEPQASDWQEIRNGAEREINVITSGDLGYFQISETPSTGEIALYVYGDGRVANKTSDFAITRLPRLTTRDHVADSRGHSDVLELDQTGEPPSVPDISHRRYLATRMVQSSPDYSCTVRHHS